MLFLNGWIKNKEIVYKKLLVCVTHPMNTSHFMPDLFTPGLENTMHLTEQIRDWFLKYVSLSLSSWEHITTLLVYSLE